MKRIFLLLVWLFVSGLAFAQTDSTQVEEEYDDEESRLVIPALNEQLKLGVKLGTGVSAFTGHELHNPIPTYLITGGVYLKWLFKPHWSLQPELNVSFKGSKFNNDALEYQHIMMYTLDVPVLLMYGINEKNTTNFVMGAQYSYILNSALYLTDAIVPENTAPALNKHDLYGVLGAQFHTPFVGFQVLAKYGFIDMNNGITLNPPNTGKDIHSLLLELNLLF